MWVNYHIEVLIRERRENNAQYHDLVGTKKRNFWKGVASKINLEFGTNYSGRQCSEKFQNLVRCYRVMTMMMTMTMRMEIMRVRVEIMRVRVRVRVQVRMQVEIMRVRVEVRVQV